MKLMKTKAREFGSSGKVYRFVKVMKRMLVMMALLVVGVAGYAPPAGAQSPAAPGPRPLAMPLKIESAMSAAPLAIAGDATILDYPAEAGQPFVTLRQGTNGWTCYPDRPDTPGDDPQCLDATWQAWLQAFESGNVPHVTAPGFAYKLQGGSEASSTTPYALEPGQGEAWVTTPPQIMLLLPGRLDPTLFSTAPGSGRPYIMWAGSAFEYLVMPVQNDPVDNLMAFPFEGLTPHAAAVDTPALGGYWEQMEPRHLASPKPATDTSNTPADLMAFPFEGLYPNASAPDTPALGGYWEQMEPRHLASPKPATDTSNTPPAGLDANGPHLGSYAIPYPSADPDGHNRPPALHYAIPYPSAASPDTTTVAGR
jgi:hypothetical protein